MNEGQRPTQAERVTSRAEVAAKLAGLLEKSKSAIVTYEEMFGAIVNVVTIMRQEKGNPNDSELVEIPGAKLDLQTFLRTDIGTGLARPSKKAIFIYSPSSDHRHIIFSKFSDGRVELLVKDKWDDVDTRGRLRCTDIPDQKFYPPTRDIRFDERTSVLELLSTGFAKQPAPAGTHK